MSTTILPRLISCDEAGFTGNRMLDGAQPYFGYASVDVDLDEANSIVNDLRSRHRLQMGELKAAKLLKRPRGRAIIAEVLERIQGRYIATLYDKRLKPGGEVLRIHLRAGPAAEQHAVPPPQPPPVYGDVPLHADAGLRRRRRGTRRAVRTLHAIA
jgi:hypothetical protein